MDTPLTISFARSPERATTPINRPAKWGGSLLPQANRELLEHVEATLYTQRVVGWQFSLYLFTATMRRARTMRLRLESGQALFVYQLKGGIHRLLHGGQPFHLEQDTYCGCYLPAGEYFFNLQSGTHETLLVTFPYGYFLWLTRHQRELQPLVEAWQANTQRAFCLRKATTFQDERRTIQRILECPKRGDELDGALKVYLARLLSLYDDRLGQPEEPAVGTILEQVQAYIETHYADQYPMHFSVIARKFGISPQALRQAYMAKYGISVATALRRQRIHAAKHLLLDTPLPLTTIAERVGFAYAESLIRAFRRETGLTPTVYRQQH